MRSVPLLADLLEHSAAVTILLMGSESTCTESVITFRHPGMCLAHNVILY